MSATGRGAEYRPLAGYMTEPALAAHLVGLLPIADGARVLEPHVGDGGFLRALLPMARSGSIQLMVNDVDPGARGLLEAAHHARTFAEDFLRLELPVRPRWVIGNPPYSIPQEPIPCPKCAGKGSIAFRDGTRSRECTTCDATGRLTPKPTPAAEQHVRRALEIVEPGGHVAFLMRLGFLEGRDDLYEEHPVRRIWQVNPRPSFTGGGNDSATYGFFHWTKGWRGGETTMIRTRWR